MRLHSDIQLKKKSTFKIFNSDNLYSICEVCYMCQICELRVFI